MPIAPIFPSSFKRDNSPIDSARGSRCLESVNNKGLHNPTAVDLSYFQVHFVNSADDYLFY